MKGEYTMKDNELKLNGSGYYDEPCYQTIKNVDAPKAGEIWTHNQSGAYMLVVANVNGVCPTIRLNEQQKDGCIPVTCRVPMYTNPAFMGYVFETNLAQYVKTVKEDEFKAVRQGLADMLGIECVTPVVFTHDAGSHPHILEEKVKALEDENKKLRADHDMAVAIADDLNAEQIELRKDLDKETYKAEFYRGMYDALIDKVISARGEA